MTITATRSLIQPRLFTVAEYMAMGEAGILHVEGLNPTTVYNACPNFALPIDHLGDQRAG